MTVKKFLLYLRYSSKRPLDITSGRWYAMVRQYNNNKEALQND